MLGFIDSPCRGLDRFRRSYRLRQQPVFCFECLQYLLLDVGIEDRRARKPRAPQRPVA